jgi:hypothetical protein
MVDWRNDKGVYPGDAVEDQLRRRTCYGTRRPTCWLEEVCVGSICSAKLNFLAEIIESVREYIICFRHWRAKKVDFDQISVKKFNS